MSAQGFCQSLKRAAVIEGMELLSTEHTIAIASCPCNLTSKVDFPPSDMCRLKFMLKFDAYGHLPNMSVTEVSIGT